MANSSILGGDLPASHPSGNDVDALGPSDTSDSGSDVQTDGGRLAPPDAASEGSFPIAHGSDTDASGTGERASADPSAPDQDADILPDRIVDSPDASDEVDDPDAGITASQLEVDADEEDEDEDPVGDASRA